MYGWMYNYLYFKRLFSTSSHFQEEAEDASVSECTLTRSALEALRNALYKFKTYLLTYLLTYLRLWKIDRS